MLPIIHCNHGLISVSVYIQYPRVNYLDFICTTEESRRGTWARARPSRLLLFMYPHINLHHPREQGFRWSILCRGGRGWKTNMNNECTSITLVVESNVLVIGAF